MSISFDIEQLKAELNLAADAHRFGSSGLPLPDATNLDGPQIKIRTHIRNELGEAFRHANARAARIWNTLAARDVSQLIADLEHLPDSTRSRVDTETRKIRADLERTGTTRAAAQRELDEYRQRFGINRDPDLKTPIERRFYIIAVLVLALFQAAINTLFFAQGATYGMAAGAGAAALLGIADVVFHGIGGRFGARLRAPRWHMFLGATTVALLIVTIPLWNLGIVHLRNGVRVHGFQAGTENWLPSLLDSPFGFTDFGSWALLLLGVVCSLSAAYAGWGWDEPIPRLLKLGTRIQECDEDIEDLTEELESVRELSASDRVRSDKDLRDRIAHNLQVMDMVVRDADALHENLVAQVEDARRAFEALIQYYRDENMLARSGTAPAPANFGVVPEFDTSLPMDLRSALAEMREFVASQKRCAAKTIAGADEQVASERGESS